MVGPRSKEVGLLLNKELLGFLFLKRGETQRRWIDFLAKCFGKRSGREEESKGQSFLFSESRNLHFYENAPPQKLW